MDAITPGGTIRGCGAAPPGDTQALCPYSEETMAGCRHYLPVSQHGGFPGAGHCRLAVKVPTSCYIRTMVCTRLGDGVD
ncbi:MAG: hypothetical protein ACHQ4F_14910 [Candidatus Dormibacteria bacterium]